jgi:superkiller protein 3
MRCHSTSSDLILRLSAILLFVGAVTAQAGAPSSIQIFMPGGALPDRSLRFELTRDDGRIETLFTDNKGKFLITGDLVRDADYVVRVEGDERTFSTTVITFRTFRNIVTYVPVFLNSLETKKRAPAGVVDVIDVNVPSEARNIYQQAMADVAKAQTENAISNFKRALAIYPQYVRALNDLGVLYLQSNLLPDAEAAFRRAIELNEKFIYPRLNLGVVLNRQGKYTEASQALEKLHRENPDLPAVSLPYAEALAETGNMTESVKVLESLLQVNTLTESVKAQAHFRLGAVLNKQNRFAGAAAQFQQALKLEPKTVMAHLQLGVALIQLNRLPEAERALLKAYELGGKSAGAAQLLLGQIYHQQLKYELAVKAFEQYLNDVPNAPNATQVVEAIERIKAALKKKA